MSDHTINQTFQEDVFKNQPKQKTAIRQLIEILKVRILRYAEFNNGEIDVASSLALRDAESLEPVNEQQIKDAFNKGKDVERPNSGAYISTNEYFNEKFKS